MNPSNYDYHKHLKRTKTVQLREIISELPSFVNSFFISLENTTTILTRVNYARDLRIFFNFLTKEVPFFSNKEITNIVESDLAAITLDDLYMYMDYLNLYADENEEFIENTEQGKARKVASLRSFFKHYYKKGVLEQNVTELLDTPKIVEKPIVRLEPDEVARLLDYVETGKNLTTKQKQYHKKTVKRDMAIFILFLTTGIRVSELASLNVKDIDFSNNSFVVTRKGGNQDILYFDDETAEALAEYLNERKQQNKYKPTSPLFLSMQGNRMSIRAIENMVKKYTKIAIPLKDITPHKLRSTFGTMLYGETGDIYLVADVLGHKDVNTTRRHYAAMSEDRRRQAAKAIKLRDD